MATIFDVAKYFRWRVDYEAGDTMTNLKLQKLCYYAQAWNLVFNKKPMFQEPLMAWDHGPANYDLYKHYRSQLDQGWDSIEPGDIKESFSPNEVFSFEELETLQEVWDTYGDLGAKRLEILTHQEDPWLKTRKNVEISHELMQEYYTQQLAQ
ncbi:DUF4065 domain-containing protein [Paenibacillus albicereus]|uniref:DUF4065 domain-containing protein n=1 Tax=Paenibacillus albicereus TaxID=2726185 RepID=A0A6H2GZA0_9BACL|nr:type II toxin-antitoxin system antitoxin SocA domain-containing protein [Paenibacillus albicereus]QJC52764.1 DUF4065 domain-containing protein [Paenibacillus albicereus]